MNFLIVTELTLLMLSTIAVFPEVVIDLRVECKEGFETERNAK